MPIAAATQSVAAVVRPRTVRPWRMIAPAPRKPMPVTICAAIRVGSARTTWSLLVRKPRKPYAETIVNSAAPRHTSRCVRRPASRSRSSRSKPIAPPSTAASERRARLSSQPSDGIVLSNGRLERSALRLRDGSDPLPREIEKLVQQLARARVALRRCLHLDDASVARHHNIHVHLGSRVLGVLEIEQRLAVHDPDRDGGHRAAERLAHTQALERAPRRDVGPADRSEE